MKKLPIRKKKKMKQTLLQKPSYTRSYFNIPNLNENNRKNVMRS